MADSGKLVKMEVDYSKAVDKMLPECQELVKVLVNGATASVVVISGLYIQDGKVTEALDKLLASTTGSTVVTDNLTNLYGKHMWLYPSLVGQTSGPRD